MMKKRNRKKGGLMLNVGRKDGQMKQGIMIRRPCASC